MTEAVAVDATVQYSCFVSHQHDRNGLTDAFALSLADALDKELRTLGAKPVFIDRRRITGGTIQWETIRRALYHSATLVVVYVPAHFDRSRPACACEYLGMEALETARKLLVADLVPSDNGMIIPVVARGFQRMPKSIRDKRQCYDFSGYTEANADLSRHSSYANQIREMAEYATAMADRLIGIPAAFAEYEKFQLADEEVIGRWIDANPTFRQEFPALTA